MYYVYLREWYRIHSLIRLRLRANDPKTNLHHRRRSPSLHRRRCHGGRIRSLRYRIPPGSENTPARSPHSPHQRLLRAPPPSPPLPHHPLLLPTLRRRRPHPLGKPTNPIRNPNCRHPHQRRRTDFANPPPRQLPQRPIPPPRCHPHSRRRRVRRRHRP